MGATRLLHAASDGKERSSCQAKGAIAATYAESFACWAEDFGYMSELQTKEETSDNRFTEDGTEY